MDGRTVFRIAQSHPRLRPQLAPPAPFRALPPSLSTIQGTLRLAQPSLFSNKLEYLSREGASERLLNSSLTPPNYATSPTPRRVASTSPAKTSITCGALISTRTFTSPSPAHFPLQIPSKPSQSSLLTVSYFVFLLLPHPAPHLVP